MLVRARRADGAGRARMGVVNDDPPLNSSSLHACRAGVPRVQRGLTCNGTQIVATRSAQRTCTMAAWRSEVSRTATRPLCSSGQIRNVTWGMPGKTPVFRRPPVMKAAAAPPHCARYLARRAPSPRRYSNSGGSPGWGVRGGRGGGGVRGFAGVCHRGRSGLAAAGGVVVGKANGREVQGVSLLSRRLSVLVATLAGAKGAAAPVCEERPRAQRCRRWPPTEQSRTRAHGRRSAPGRAAHARTKLNRPEWPACTAGRGDRRAATANRRTTNGAFSARYLRACAVPHDGEKQRPLSPRRYLAARAAVGDVRGCSARGSLRVRCGKNDVYKAN